jgi:hypothetical protein
MTATSLRQSLLRHPADGATLSDDLAEKKKDV